MIGRQINDVDNVFFGLGLEIVIKRLYEYLATNYPTPEHREFLAGLFENFPQFVIKTKIYRASRVKGNFSRELRNKFVSGCKSLEDVTRFVEKRYDKGYKYILMSNDEIECFNLHEFIDYLNDRYDGVITDFYQDEKEVVFKFKAPYNWFEVKKIE